MGQAGHDGGGQVTTGHGPHVGHVTSVQLQGGGVRASGQVGQGGGDD